MATLRNLKPKLNTVNPARRAATTKDARMTGRRLQDRRLRIWSSDPTCSSCGRVTDYPGGFELDHKVPLFMGGQDVEDNCQVLCLDCHKEKTAEDLGYAEKKEIGLDGWPVSS